MKFRRFLFPALMAVAVSFTACGDDEPEESCDGEDLGAEMCSNDFDAIATFCSDGENKSYYSYGGENFYCEGTAASTCQKALDDIAVKMIEDGCDISKKSSVITAQAKMTKMAEELLNQVRLNSIEL